MNPTILETAINNFRQYLIHAYPSFKIAYDIYASGENDRNCSTESYEDYFHDWAQAVWELLVERITSNNNESLQIYGSGSDYEGGGYARVFFHDLIPTHEIICIPKDKSIDTIMNEEVDLSRFTFEGFVAKIEGWYEYSTPFDHVLLHEREVYGGGYRQIVVPIDQIKFTIGSYKS